MQHTGERPLDLLTLHLYPGSGESLLYEDDGQTWAYQQGECRLTRFRLETEWADNARLPARIRLERSAEGGFEPAYKRTRVVLHGLQAAPQQILVDGEAASGGRLQPDAHPCPVFYHPAHPPYVLELDSFRTIEVVA
jgi:alpha-glucosidase